MSIPPLPPDAAWRPLRGLASAQVRLAGFHNADIIVGEVEGDLPEGALERALHTLAERHPVLRARLRITGAPSFFIDPTPQQPVPLSVWDGAWQDAARDAIALPLGETGHCWRAIVVPQAGSFHVVLAVHHAFVDGRSLSVLLRDLLQLLEDPGRDGAVHPDPITSPELWKRPFWVGLILGVLRHVWAWRAAKNQATAPLHGERLAPGAPVPVLFDGRLLDPALLPALVKASRAQKATVGGAVMAAAWEATRTLYRRRGAGDAPPTPIDAMIDLRPMLEGAPDVGMLASGGVALLSNAPADPWERARDATKRLTQQVDWRFPLVVHELADGVDVRQRLGAYGVDFDKDGGSGAGVQVSNVGVWGFGTNFGPYQLRGAWSATSAVRTGPTLLAWLRTVDGRGCMSAIGNAAVVSKDDLTFWVNEIERELNKMLT